MKNSISPHLLSLQKTIVQKRLDEPYNICLKNNNTYRQDNCIEMCVIDIFKTKYNCSLASYYQTNQINICDSKRVLEFLELKNAKKYHINPEKLAILGASAGAQLATLVGVTPNSSIYNNSSLFSDDVQAIINIDGIVSFIHPEAQESDSAGMWLGGLEDENPKNWKEASPLEYVNEKSPPTLFINSTQPRFHAGRDDMITILNKYNI